LFNVTVTGNEANSAGSAGGKGGGVLNDLSATFNFVDSIIAGNTNLVIAGGRHVISPEDCAGTLTSQGYDIVSDTTDCTVGGPYLLADAKLGPLRDNGGPTLTHALLPGSPAIDAGQPGDCTDGLGAPITTDQRGVGRPQGPRCDIGAFEVQ